MVDNYCEGIAGGSIVACEFVRQAVERYWADLDRVGDAEFPYLFDFDMAEAACMFFPVALRHSIGEWQGQPFTLSPWQAFIHWNVHGWRNRSDNARRFRKVFASVARKNGKTTYCAGTSIQSAICDINPITGLPENVAKVLIGATKIDQAKIMFEETVRMAQQSPFIYQKCDVTKLSIFFQDTQSVIKPLASDRPFSGENPSSMLFDEVHEFTERHRKFFDTMTTGSGSRVQPLQWVITTASDDQGLLYHEEAEYARKVVSGIVKDETLFAVIYELDADDDPFDESVWGKANPNLGTSVKLDYLRNQANEAKAKPSKKAPFVRFHCNRCVKSVEQSVIPPVSALSDWETADSIGYGTDLGGMDDLASIAAVARFKVGETDGDDPKPIWRYEAKSKSFMSQQTRRDLTVQPWTTWTADGDLEVVEYVFSHVQKELTEEMDSTGSTYFAYDPQFAGQLAESVERLGYSPIKMPQRHWTFNEPMLEMFSAIAEGRFVIDERDRILLWAFSNMAINRDPSGKVMPDKKRSKDKIDPAVAVIMALKACMAAPERHVGSLFMT